MSHDDGPATSSAEPSSARDTEGVATQTVERDDVLARC